MLLVSILTRTTNLTKLAANVVNIRFFTLRTKSFSKLSLRHLNLIARLVFFLTYFMFVFESSNVRSMSFWSTVAHVAIRTSDVIEARLLANLA